jgi:uncharacterized protein
MKEVYRIPIGKNDNIIYAPLKGILFSANDKFCENLVSRHIQDETLHSEFSELGLFDEDVSDGYEQNESVEKLIEKALFPTDAIFLISNFCNFRCKYCYASSEGTVSKKFDKKMLLDTVKFVIDNAFRLKKDECTFSFHGGGEPTLRLDLIKECVDFANYYKSLSKADLKISSMAVSNGFLNESEIEWIARNLDSIQISFDGPQWIHDDQRPFGDGSSTFQRVYDTIRHLIELNMPGVMIKSTISRRHASDMPEIAEFLCKNFNVEKFHFGAVLNCGRALVTGYDEPISDIFVLSLLEAQQIAESYNKTIVSSLAQETFPNIRHEFCGVTAPNFTITVDGDVTACYEVANVSDKRSIRYYYAKYDPEGEKFNFDIEKIKKLVSSRAVFLEKCRNCFVKWQCAGDCQARWFDSETGKELTTDDFRCKVNRALVLEKMKKMIKR